MVRCSNCHAEVPTLEGICTDEYGRLCKDCEDIADSVNHSGSE
jgi:uncharacterized membrane protein